METNKSAHTREVQEIIETIQLQRYRRVQEGDNWLVNVDYLKWHIYLRLFIISFGYFGLFSLLIDHDNELKKHMRVVWQAS